MRGSVDLYISIIATITVVATLILLVFRVKTHIDNLKVLPPLFSVSFHKNYFDIYNKDSQKIVLENYSYSIGRKRDMNHWGNCPMGIAVGERRRVAWALYEHLPLPPIHLWLRIGGRKGWLFTYDEYDEEDPIIKKPAEVYDRISGYGCLRLVRKGAEFS